MNETTTNADELDVAHDLVITSKSARPVGGTWVSGRLADHEFEALVFPEHAENPDFEVEGESRISKLWVRRLADEAVVYNWDRGLDVPAADPTAAAIVAFL